MKSALTPSAAPAPGAAQAKPAWPTRLIPDSRFVPPIFITLILLAGQFGFGLLESVTRTLLAIATAIAVELVLSRIFTGKWPHVASAYITGISVGILVRAPAFWPYALCSAISITSKYVLRVKDRHIWNPSNFGICWLLLAEYLYFVPGTESLATLSVQWGNNLYPMLVIWLLGSLIIAKHKRFHICVTYVVSFFVFAWLRTLFTGHGFLAEVAPITGPMYQLFVFFMITDPKTTVKSKRGQCAVAFAVALMECILRLTENIHAPYYALFIVGPVANLIEMWWTSRKSAAAPIAASAASPS